MGVISPTNNMKFKSSQKLFSRIKKRLSEYDANDMVDDGDFHKHVAYILEQLGAAVSRECETVLHVKDFRAKLPDNFRTFHMAMRCSFKSGTAPSINEQSPIIYYTDTEFSQVDAPNKCGITCNWNEERNKVVVRTYVVGEDNTGCSYEGGAGLRLSRGASPQCTEEGERISAGFSDEIFINDENYLYANFEEDTIYMQYYGLPVDEDGMPMIPVNEAVEKAIEYYILSIFFEDMYLLGNNQNVVQILGYVKNEYNQAYGQAVYSVKLPTFQKMIDLTRKQRRKNKFFNFASDRTLVQ